MRLKEQLEALKDIPISIVKVGLICNVEQARAIATFIIARDLPMVLDPVLSSSSEFEFFKPSDIAAYVDILLPLTTLVTPNLQEACLLTNLAVDAPDAIELAAESMLLLGANNVFIKGGHSDDDYCQDYFASDARCFWLTSERHLSRNTRGTGCALASVIASTLAQGYPIYDAVVIAKMAVNQGIRNGYRVGEFKGPVAITQFPDSASDLPILSNTATVDWQAQNFLDCNQPPLGLYPVVDSAAWLKKLANSGVSTIQLRIKDLRGTELEKEIEKAVKLAEEFGFRLFINDHWELAIKYDAYGVHLGQEDLDTADIDAIRESGLRLGISTHCHFEVARAIHYKPSYLACGPVYHTDTKQMPWTPHGVAGLSYWRKVIDYPLVAIGGINESRLAEVAAVGVDSVAMITAITQAGDPVGTANRFVATINASEPEHQLATPQQS